MIRRAIRNGSTRLPIGGLSALTAALILSACATSPAPVSPQPEARPTPPATAGTATKPKVVQKRGGGYYKDDGPGDDIPDNLDAIPDATPRAEPLHPFANNPYNVFGKDYVPATSVKPYQEQGLASWYGRKFHGKPTSSGEKYDMYGMTAAHPTLPIPSYARITNLRNGKSVIVRINDRGPFHTGRSIDLSYAAAYKLEYLDTGHTDVEIEAIVPEGIEVLAENIPPIRQRGKPVKRNSPPPVTLAQRTPAPADKAPPVIASAEATPPTASLPPSIDVKPLAPAAVATVATAAGAATTASAAATAPLVTAAATTPPPVPTATQRSGIFLQLGAFTTAANAESFRKFVGGELSALAGQLEVLLLDGRFRLHAGPFASESEARSMAVKISDALRFKPFLVTR
ncbi:septal ring lytic transglycosylase RlpA family protein [Niveibacterium umoris]|uniref:Endolytic peptidoglycan transglycosylase RlpA n=1 Tax=Niveibacterium umoris TaxID=1193620 RepID=A0A840BKW9_9RHOO|nr:septal ring lytic transglycosylase RlpA family protein [Niveibacterium umoris]MBB4014211.1 rare lipoprotein A [Niveibacterium umoris]